MRIGIDARIIGAGGTGIGRYTRNLIRELIPLSGEHTLVLFLTPEGAAEFKVTAPHVEIITIDAPHYSLAEQTRFLKAIQLAQVDLMHFTHFNAPLRWHGRTIVTIHDLTLHLYPGQNKNRWYHRLAYRTTVRHITQQAQTVIAVSHHTEQDLIKYLHLPAHKIKVVYEGIETDPPAHRDPVTLSQLQIPTPYLVYVGVFRTHKNIDGLLKAFAIVRQVYHLPHHLVLVGSKSAEYENLKQLAHQLHLTEVVHFTGRLNDTEMGQVISQAEAFVFPSFYEGFGLPPLEAMALGTPCLCARTSSIPEVCGEAARYFDPRDPYDMAEQINHLLTHPAAQELLKQKGAEQIKKFSWRTMAEQIWQLYLNLPA